MNVHVFGLFAMCASVHVRVNVRLTVCLQQEAAARREEPESIASRQRHAEEELF